MPMTGPQQQERKAGNVLIDLGSDVHAEVSEYNGSAYAALRRWFRADDGKWYRTKNGLHLRLEQMVEVVAHAEELARFLVTRKGGDVAGGEERNVTSGEEQPGGEDVPF